MNAARDRPTTGAKGRRAQGRATRARGARRRGATRAPGIRRRGWIITLSVLGLVIAIVATGVFAAGPLGDAVREVAGSVAGDGAPDVQQSVVVPPVSLAVSQPGSTPGALPGLAGLADVAWATRVAAETNISVRAIQAYAGVAIAKQNENPACHLGWNTLAAVGATESGNGTHGGSTVQPDGQVSPPIFGPDLDGNGFALVPDSDAGAIDGDATGDRAVGPLQLIPEAWRNWGTDANGDGVADPQNFDDAALSAANYLCYAGGDLSTDAGWKKAIAAYNHDNSYAVTVSGFANRFAAATG